MPAPANDEAAWVDLIDWAKFDRRTVVAATGCVVWTGQTNNTGYGLWNVAGAKRRLTHRLAYVRARGAIPFGLTLDHLCRNTLCCNPNHLQPVTSSENVKRSTGPCMQNASKTHCAHGHEFTPENTAPIPGRLSGGRRCRTCSALASRRQKQRARKTSAPSCPPGR